MKGEEGEELKDKGRKQGLKYVRPKGKEISVFVTVFLFLEVACEGHMHALLRKNEDMQAPPHNEVE